MKSLLLLSLLGLLSLAAPPGRTAARPAYFRIGTPFHVDDISIFDASLLADSGGFVVFGFRESTETGRRCVGVAATSATGRPLWSRAYGVRHAISDLHAIRTHEGGLLVWGLVEQERPYLLRLSPKGESLWCRDPAERRLRRLHDVEQTSSGAFVAAATESVACLLKINALGDALWCRACGGRGSRSVWQTADGGYVLTGETKGAVYIVRTDGHGKMLWSRSYGNQGIGSGEGRSVQQTKDGGFVVAGKLSRRRFADDPYLGFNVGEDGDAYLMRTDSDGDTLWTRTYGDRLNQSGDWVRETADGGFIMVGQDNRSTSGILCPGDIRTCVVRTDTKGDMLWTCNLDDLQDWGCWSVCQTADDGLAIAALDAAEPFYTPGDSVSIKVITIDTHGNVTRPR